MYSEQNFKILLSPFLCVTNKTCLFLVAGDRKFSPVFLEALFPAVSRKNILLHLKMIKLPLTCFVSNTFPYTLCHFVK